MKINWSWKKWNFKNIFYRVWIIFNIGFLNLFLKNKKIDKDLKYYFGSSWWSLNTKSIKYILNYYESNQQFNNIFKYADASDEMYFQTILLNSTFKKECVNKNLRYIDWDRKREWPAILDENDFLKIKNTNNLFARKFSIKSKKLLNKIKTIVKKEEK